MAIVKINTFKLDIVPDQRLALKSSDVKASRPDWHRYQNFSFRLGLELLTSASALASKSATVTSSRNSVKSNYSEVKERSLSNMTPQTARLRPKYGPVRRLEGD